MGHNNVITGVQKLEMVSKLIVLGHNNTVKDLMIRRLEVLGHNNKFKNLNLVKQPSNNGFSNSFSNVQLVDSSEENITYDTSGAQNYGISSESSESSDDDEEDYGSAHVHHQNFAFNTNFGDDMANIIFNIQTQTNDLLNGVNISHGINTNIGVGSSDDDSEGGSYGDSDYDEESEEEKDYGLEEEDEEAHISPEERREIINSINSFAYQPKNKKEDENCAVCLCKLEVGQQVKSLPCKHMFHPK